MINRSLQALCVAVVLLVASAIPASAQFSVGLSVLNNDGGPGVNVDYSKAYKTMAQERTLGWLVDFSVNHKSLVQDFGITTIIAEGGVRWGGKAGDKGTFHVQGSAGLLRVNTSLDSTTEAACTLVVVDCSASASSFVITPAGAYTWWFSPRHGLKGQANFPIAVTNDGGNFARLDVDFVMKLDK